MGLRNVLNRPDWSSNSITSHISDSYFSVEIPHAKVAQLNWLRDLKFKFKWCYFCAFGQKHRADFYMAGLAECMKETESRAELIPPNCAVVSPLCWMPAYVWSSARVHGWCMAIMQGYSSPLAAGKNEELANCWTSPLFRGLFLLSADGSDWRCQRAVQTQSCQRAGVEVRVQMPSGWNRGFTRKVRREVWGHQMETETTRSSGGMICECWMTLNFLNTMLVSVLPESSVGKMWGHILA